MDEARRIAKTLVEENLVACANIFPIISVYQWNGVQESPEVAVILKTESGKIKDVEIRVKQLHSYEVPCIISFDIKYGSKEFLDWISESVR